MLDTTTTPTHRAFHVPDHDFDSFAGVHPGELEIGKAWFHRDSNSFTMQLDRRPISDEEFGGHIVLRPIQPTTT
jgi:hypothetical protein